MLSLPMVTVVKDRTKKLEDHMEDMSDCEETRMLIISPAVQIV